MAKAAQKSTRYRMTFPAAVVNEPLMATLTSKFDVVPNILRGRITDKGAYLEVELVGGAKNTEKALKYLTDKGVTVQQM